MLGLIDGDFAVIGDDLVDGRRAPCSTGCSARGGELVTAGRRRGRRARPRRGGRRRTLERRRPEVDVVVYDGGQPRYPLLIGVE